MSTYKNNSIVLAQNDISINHNNSDDKEKFNINYDFCAHDTLYNIYVAYTKSGNEEIIKSITANCRIYALREKYGVMIIYNNNIAFIINNTEHLFDAINVLRKFKNISNNLVNRVNEQFTHKFYEYYDYIVNTLIKECPYKAEFKTGVLTVWVNIYPKYMIDLSNIVKNKYPEKVEYIKIHVDYKNRIMRVFTSGKHYNANNFNEWCVGEKLHKNYLTYDTLMMIINSISVYIKRR